MEESRHAPPEEVRGGELAPEIAVRTGESAAVAVTPGGAAAAADAADFVPLAGYALLGLAGAYLLRAATGSGAIPPLAGALAGILYAAWWLYLAARHARKRPLFSTVHGLTAAVILAPLVWEMTVRFELLGAWTATGVLAGFALCALAIGWRRNLTRIVWSGTAAALVTASALYRETHDAGAWAAAVLLVAAAVEFSACRDHWLGLRWIAAFAADLTVLVLSLLATRPPEPGLPDLPSPGVVFGAQIALLTIYLSSTVDRTILRGLHISHFEIVQSAMALLISVGGALLLANSAQAPPAPVGLFCLLGGAVCYLVSFAFLERREGRERNFYTYSTFAALLTGAGCRVLLDGAAVAGVWSGLAAAMMWAGLFGGRTTLRVHAAVYLLFGAASSGLLPLAFHQIVRGAPHVPAAAAAPSLLVCAGALACYAMAGVMRGRRAAHWTAALEPAVSAALLAAGIAGLLAAAFPGSTVYRTAVVVVLACASAWVGRRWQRRELVWLAYPLMALAPVKLVLEDLPAGTQSWALPLLLTGGAFVLLRRLLRGEAAPASPGS